MSSECWNCGWDNVPDVSVCEKCGTVLRLETTAMQEPEPSPHPPAWGTKTFQSVLVLHVRGENQPIEVMLEDGVEIIVGRLDPETGKAPAVDLSALGRVAESVSRRHIVLTSENGLLRIADLGSANATWLNGQKLPAGQLRLLREDDEILLVP
jgi:hypothetical protein